MFHGLKWFRGFVNIESSDSEDFIATIRIGYADSDTSSDIGVMGAGSFNGSGVIGVSSPENEDTTVLIGIPAIGTKDYIFGVRPVNAAITSFNGAVYVMFDGDLETIANLGVPADGLSDTMAHMLIVGATEEALYAEVWLAMAGIYSQTDLSTTSDIGIVDSSLADVVTTMAVMGLRHFTAPGTVGAADAGSYSLPVRLKVVTGIGTLDITGSLAIVSGLTVAETIKCMAGIMVDGLFDLPGFIEVDPKTGVQFLASAGIKAYLQKSVPCGLTITEYGSQRAHTFEALGSSGKDILTSAGIPYGSAKARGKVGYTGTRYGLSALPSWMDMVKFTNSVGSSFFNAIGTELVALEDEIMHTVNNYFIESCSPKIDIIGYAPLPSSGVSTVTVPMFERIDGTKYRWRLREADSSYKFYHSDKYYRTDAFSLPDGSKTNEEYYTQAGLETFDTYYIDVDNKTIYFRFSNGRYNSAIVNGETITIAWRQLWNELDDLGALIALPRLQWEDNGSYKARIMDVFSIIEYSDEKTRGGEPRSVVRTKAPDSTFIGLSVAIARELGLATFDEEGNFLVKIRSISDEDFQLEELLDEDMIPNDLFDRLVEEINRTSPVGWDYARWDIGRWFLETEVRGWPVLKSVWDILYMKSSLGSKI